MKSRIILLASSEDCHCSICAELKAGKLPRNFIYFESRYYFLALCRSEHVEAIFNLLPEQVAAYYLKTGKIIINDKMAESLWLPKAFKMLGIHQARNRRTNNPNAPPVYLN